METEKEVKIKKSYIFPIIVVIIVIGAVVGFKIYDNGQKDMLEKVRREEARKQLEENNKAKIIELKNTIPQIQAKLQMANDELSEINSFHFLRTPTEKEQQLAAQNKRIAEIKEVLIKLQSELAELENTRY